VFYVSFLRKQTTRLMVKALLNAQGTFCLE